MRSERGQATVEWVGILLLVAIALAALAHFAPGANGTEMGKAVARSVTRPVARPAGEAAAPAHAPIGRGFAIPPLIPRAGESIPRAGESIPRAGESAARLGLRLPRARTLLPRVRAGGGEAWRRALIACLVYERFRYALLHPESRFYGHTIPVSEVLRMVNDCISPFDLVRDWPEVSGR